MKAIALLGVFLSLVLGNDRANAASTCNLLLSASSPVNYSDSCEFTIQASSLCDGAEKYTVIATKKVTITFTARVSCEERPFHWVRDGVTIDSVRTMAITSFLNAGYELFNYREGDRFAIYLLTKK